MASRSRTVTAPPVGPLIRILRRNGIRKGIFGGSRGWAAVAVGTWGYTTLKRLARREPELVFSEELEAGGAGSSSRTTSRRFRNGSQQQQR